jgi:hypothetical protein
MTSKWMLSCDKATELIDKRSVIDITCNEKWQLKFHTIMCKACHEYRKQSKFMDKILSYNTPDMNEDREGIIINEDLKKRIQSNL